MNDHRGHLRVHVDGVSGETYHRDPAEVGPPAGRQPEVRVLPLSAHDRAAGVHRYETTVEGWVFEVRVEDEPRALLREKAGQGIGAAGRKGSDTIRAQIPGRVVRLWVAEGDVVEAGQRLLAIEAMKMENEIRAPHAGTVEHVAVEPGSSVELRDELLRLA
ncbi:MAG: biotin/lipoyl-containing protein [Candidatus Limnocylindrales bacterium]